MQAGLHAPAARVRTAASLAPMERWHSLRQPRLSRAGQHAPSSSRSRPLRHGGRQKAEAAATHTSTNAVLATAPRNR
ncbi:hypothetical protein GGH92_002185 [Coemansia sp. RSA 2673]|nr:hypothetical protein GGH92_002185 [Coemansia sp. RSA 2673]